MNITTDKEFTKRLEKNALKNYFDHLEEIIEHGNERNVADSTVIITALAYHTEILNQIKKAEEEKQK